MSAAGRVMDNQRRLSLDCAVHGIDDPGPPVTSGSTGVSACASSRLSPAWVSFPLTHLRPAQPTPTNAPRATARPAVRRSFTVPPSTAAAPRAANELRADSAAATPSSARVTAGPIAAAVGTDTERLTSSSAGPPSTWEPARASPVLVSA